MFKFGTGPPKVEVLVLYIIPVGPAVNSSGETQLYALAEIVVWVFVACIVRNIELLHLRANAYTYGCSSGMPSSIRRLGCPGSGILVSRIYTS